MDKSSCNYKAGNEAKGFADSSEENQNYIFRFNCGSITEGVTLRGRSSNPVDRPAFSDSVSANSKAPPSAAFESQKESDEFSLDKLRIRGDTFHGKLCGLRYRYADVGKSVEKDKTDNPLLVDKTFEVLAPTLNKSPLVLKAGIEVRSTWGLKRVFNPATTPVCQKLPLKEVLPSRDQDILSLDCSEDDLSLIGWLSEEEDNILSISKEDEEELLKSEDEELVEMRHYLLESRGKRNLQSDVHPVSVLSLENDVLKHSCDKDLEKSDVDTDLEEQLLRSDDEEPLETLCEVEKKTEDLCPNEEANDTCTTVDVKESSEIVEIVDEELVECRVMEEDEELLLWDADSVAEKALDGLLESAEELSRVAEVEAELFEETVRLTDDGDMVFSEHSDEEEEEQVVEDDDLEIVFIRRNGGSEVKLGAEVVNKSLSRAPGEGSKVAVSMSNELDLSAEKMPFKGKQFALFPSCEALSQRAEEVSLNHGKVLKTDDDVRIVDEDDFQLALSSERGDDLSSQGDESQLSKVNEEKLVDQQLAQVEDVSRGAQPRGVEETDQSNCQLGEDSDVKEWGRSAGCLPNKECTKEVQEVEIGGELLYGLCEKEVSSSQYREDVSILPNCKKVYYSQPLEVPISQQFKEVHKSGSQNVDEVLGSLHVHEALVSQHVEKVPVSQLIEVVPVTQYVKEVPISQNIQGIPEAVSAPLPIDVVTTSRCVEVVSPPRNEVQISQVLENSVLQSIEVMSSQRHGGSVLPQLATRKVSQVSQAVENSAPQRAEDVTFLRGDVLYTRRDGLNRQSANVSSTRRAPLLRTPVPVPSVLRTSQVERQSSSTLKGHEATYHYQADDNFPTHHEPAFSDPWENQQNAHNFCETLKEAIISDFLYNYGSDIAWDYQHRQPVQWNHLLNGPPDSSSSANLFPNPTTNTGFDCTFAVDSTIQLGGAQTTPAFLADETSTDFKACTFTNNNFKPHSDDHFKEDEIEDNNDPRWDEIRSLKTDAERYASLRKRWGNLMMPDPRKNLTTHNYLLRNRARKLQAAGASTPIFTNGRKRKASPTLFGERPGKRLCRILDDKFADVERQTNEDIGRLNGERLFQINKVEQEKEEAISDFVKAYGNNFLTDEYFNELEYKTSQRRKAINNYFGREMDDVWKRRMKATEELKSALNEMEAFYKFYGNDTNVHLTPEEVEVFVEQERMFSMYDKFYSS